MLYLGTDQNARQFTISLLDENADVLQARRVSTPPEKIQVFFAKLTRERITDGESLIAVVEVCGFNDWPIQLPRDYRCHLRPPRAAVLNRRQHPQKAVGMFIRKSRRGERVLSTGTASRYNLQ